MPGRRAAKAMGRASMPMAESARLERLIQPIADAVIDMIDRTTLGLVKPHGRLTPADIGANGHRDDHCHHQRQKDIKQERIEIGYADIGIIGIGGRVIKRAVEIRIK